MTSGHKHTWHEPGSKSEWSLKRKHIPHRQSLDGPKEWFHIISYCDRQHKENVFPHWFNSQYCLSSGNRIAACQATFQGNSIEKEWSTVSKYEQNYHTGCLPYEYKIYSSSLLCQTWRSLLSLICCWLHCHCSVLLSLCYVSCSWIECWTGRELWDDLLSWTKEEEGREGANDS